MSGWGRGTLVGLVLPSMGLDCAVTLFTHLLLKASCITRETNNALKHEGFKQIVLDQFQLSLHRVLQHLRNLVEIWSRRRNLEEIIECEVGCRSWDLLSFNDGDNGGCPYYSKAYLLL